MEKDLGKVNVACGNFKMENVFNVHDEAVFMLLRGRKYVVPSEAPKTVKDCEGDEWRGCKRLYMNVWTNASDSSKLPLYQW